MSLTLVVSSVESTGNLHVFGTITISGSYVAGGDAIDFTTVADKIGASQSPLQVWVSGSTGDVYAFVRAASPTLANGKIKISTASSTELSAGAYPARFTGDTNVQFEATFRKLL